MYSKGCPKLGGGGQLTVTALYEAAAVLNCTIIDLPAPVEFSRLMLGDHDHLPSTALFGNPNRYLAEMFFGGGSIFLLLSVEMVVFCRFVAVEGRRDGWTVMFRVWLLFEVEVQ